ncbi:MAG: AI-2E family transporter [Deltaproteobacteria bacterium]|nr:AI-2E family transporter [Deltaproteobacteria bacterium]
MLFNGKPYTLDRIVRIVITVGLLGGLIWLLGYLSDVLIPFAVALLLAYLINPLVLLVQKKVENRVAAVFISLFAVLMGVVLLGWLFIPVITKEIAHMGKILTAVVSNSDLAERAAKYLPPDLWQAVKDYAARKEVQDFFQTGNFWSIAEGVTRKVLPGVWGVITGTASFIMGLVGLAVIGLYLVFLLFNYQKIKESWKDLIPPAYREAVTGFVEEFNLAMKRYFRGQAAVASIVGVLFALGFWIIGLPMGVLLGLFIGLLNMVPYLQIIGLIPAFLLALVHALEMGGSLWMILSLTGLVFAVVQIIQDVILVPKIMGRVTGLSPAMILLSLSIWGKLLGVFGLLIALPITCLLLAYYRRFLVTAEVRDATLSSAGE